LAIDIRPGAVDPRLVSKLSHTSLNDASTLLREMRLIKCKEELDLIRKCGTITDLGQQTLMREIKVGRAQLEVGSEAVKVMQREVARKYPKAAAEIRANVMGAGPIFSPMPHTTRGVGRPIENGDSLIDLTMTRLNGYGAENERTFIIGETKGIHLKIFTLMTRAQEEAFKAQQPGNKMSQVDASARKIIEDAGYGDYIMHRTCHGIGLGVHEYPYQTAFLDRKIKPGMVLSCEPGIYIPNVGGFRHSDTVIVTEDGPELVTRFPRDLESLLVAHPSP